MNVGISADEVWKLSLHQGYLESGRNVPQYEGGKKKDATCPSVHSSAKNVCALGKKTSFKWLLMDRLWIHWGISSAFHWCPRKIKEPERKFQRHIYFQLLTRSASSKINSGLFEY